MNAPEKPGAAASTSTTVWLPYFCIGLLFGVLTMTVARAGYYWWLDLRSNMSPLIAIFFFPFIWLILFLVSSPIEALMRRIGSAARSAGGSVAIGAAYASLLIPWAFPGHWFVLLVINPIVCRLMLHAISVARQR